jgi:hypothetical protein
LEQDGREQSIATTKRLGKLGGLSLEYPRKNKMTWFDRFLNEPANALQSWQNSRILNTKISVRYPDSVRLGDVSMAKL